LMHEEHHEDPLDDHDEEHEEDSLAFLNNSDYKKENLRIGASKAGDWGYFGFSYSKNDGLYGVPFHREPEGAHAGHDDHEDHEDPHDDHEDERIIATTESDILNFSGSVNLNSGFLKSVEYHFRDTDYTLSEAHVEEEEPHDDDAHPEGPDGGHDHEAPTIFTNDAKEYGAIFDISTDTLRQKLALEFVSEDVAIFGAEAFMNPASTDEVTIGYYVSREFGGFTFDLGVRNDWVDRSGSVTEEHEEEPHEEEPHEEEPHEEEVEYFDTEESVTSYGLQISRALNDRLSATLNLSSVERAPAAVELFMSGSHLATGRYEVGDPDLQTEEATSVELLFDYSSDTFFGSFSVYSNDIDNYIYLLDNPEEEVDGLLSANYFQQDAEFRGYEFEVGGIFPVAGGDLTLSFGADSTNAEFSDGANVPRINPDRSIYKAAYSQGNFGMSIVLKDVQSQTDLALNENVTDGYSMLNMKVSNMFTLSNDVDLYVSIFGRNLLNEIARNHASFVKNEVPLPGKSYGLKFSAEF